MPTPSKDSSGRACPHCGKSPGLKWTALLPSNNPNRSYACQACGGRYDTSDISKMASLFGGLLGLGPGIYAFGHLVKGQGRSALVVTGGTMVVVLAFGAGSLALAWLALRFVSKPAP